MKWCIEAWSFPCEDCNIHEMIEAREFDNEGDALSLAWDYLKRGYAVRLWLR
jgi:hypothetical protein